MSAEVHADELFEEFKETSITEFFRKNRTHLGYSGKLRSLTTVIHELMTNALDACEEAGLLPEIYVEIKKLRKDHYKVTCIDNGPGIPPKHIPKVFGKMLAGTKFHRNIQLRGQQGIGVAGVTLFSQITCGKPIRVRSSTGDGEVYDLNLMIDITKNKANITKKKAYNENWRGTEVTCEFKGVKFSLREQGPFEYIRRTAVANPHLRIIFVDPNGRKTIFERSSNRIPKKPIPVKPHPEGVEVDDLLTMAQQTNSRKFSSFMVKSFARVSNNKIEDLQKEVSFDMNKNPRRVTWEECEEVVEAIDKVKFLSPPTKGLVPIGEEQIKGAVLNILDPEFDAVLTRSPEVHSGGVPFQVEVAMAFGGHAGREVGDKIRLEIMRFANRAPLLFDAGSCVITNAVKSVDWKRYGIKDYEDAPFTVFINLVSTYVPYTSAGKQSVAKEPNVYKEIRMALMEVGRKFKKYHSKKRKAREREQKRQILLKYSTELASALATITEEDEEKLLENLHQMINDKLKPVEVPGKESEEGEE